MNSINHSIGDSDQIEVKEEPVSRRVLVLVRENDSYTGEKLSSIAGTLRQRGYDVEVQSFPRTTNEAEIRAWAEAHAGTAAGKTVLCDVTCSGASAVLGASCSVNFDHLVEQASQGLLSQGVDLGKIEPRSKQAEGFGFLDKKHPENDRQERASLTELFRQVLAHYPLPKLFIISNFAASHTGLRHNREISQEEGDTLAVAAIQECLVTAGFQGEIETIRVENPVVDEKGEAWTHLPVEMVGNIGRLLGRYGQSPIVIVDRHGMVGLHAKDFEENICFLQLPLGDGIRTAQKAGLLDLSKEGAGGKTPEQALEEELLRAFPASAEANISAIKGEARGRWQQSSRGEGAGHNS